MNTMQKTAIAPLLGLALGALGTHAGFSAFNGVIAGATSEGSTKQKLMKGTQGFLKSVVDPMELLSNVAFSGASNLAGKGIARLGGGGVMKAVGGTGAGMGTSMGINSAFGSGRVEEQKSIADRYLA